MFWLNLTEYARKRNQEMDWNSKILRTTPFISRPSQIFTNFLCNSNFDSFQGLETKQDGQVNLMMAPINPQESEIMTTSYGGQEKRIRRLTTDQLESLECSFQAERKLEPSRKIKLANELGLQPRQVAVWFQNRRARWKAKKIEHLYDALKEDYALVSSEKHKLQEEVVRLKSMVMELSNRKKVVSIGSKETYGDETEECSQSTMVAIRRSSNNMLGEGSSEVGVSNFDQYYQGNYLFNNVNDFASMPPPYRGAYT